MLHAQCDFVVIIIISIDHRIAALPVKHVATYLVHKIEIGVKMIVTFTISNFKCINFLKRNASHQLNTITYSSCYITPMVLSVAYTCTCNCMRCIMLTQTKTKTCIQRVARFITKSISILYSIAI